MIGSADVLGRKFIKQSIMAEFSFDEVLKTSPKILQTRFFCIELILNTAVVARI